MMLLSVVWVQLTEQESKSLSDKFVKQKANKRMLN